MNEVSVLREQVKQFVEEASEKELEMIYHLFEASTKNDWWDEINPAHKAAIDNGIQQLDNGEGIPHVEVMKKYNKWLKESGRHSLSKPMMIS